MLRVLLFAFAVLWGSAAAAERPPLQESGFWQSKIDQGQMPPIAERIPQAPLVVDMAAKGREFGTQGGTLRTLVSRRKDIRQMVVYGYARLVGYDQDYTLQPDILERFEVEEGRKFTFHLRPGHRWSNGAPFTSADFEYWWVHVANNPELSPGGPPEYMSVNGAFPTVSFPDAYTVIFEWAEPNAKFLPLLAAARPPFIYRPSEYLKQFHIEFTGTEALRVAVQDARVRGWAPLHNKRDSMYKFDNPDQPTLQPWVSASKDAKSRHVFVRNPYYHRIDARGVQLPYIDVVTMTVVGAGLIPAKANAGEVDLQARGLGFRDVSILMKGEHDGGGYRTLLWGNGAASQIAIFPNLNYTDPTWRTVLRDARFRRALSLGIDRRIINRALFFGLGKEGGMTVLEKSPFFDPANRAAWAGYDVATANALLDEMGLTERDGSGLRLLPDGRPLELVIETAGERQEVGDALQIIADTWREIGVRLIVRPLDRDILRNRVYAGVSMAAVWFGWDNGIPGPTTPPSYLAPREQEFFAWPKWGQYYQTMGDVGEAPDMDAPKRLMYLAKSWEETSDQAKRDAIWREMLAIHADQVYAIGIVSETPQPVVVSERMRNVPTDALWAWDPGAQFGIHRIDEFFFAAEPPQDSAKVQQ